MNGMHDIVKTRLQGRKPSQVWLSLVDKHRFRDGFAYLGDGSFTVDIGSSERLEDLDLRPLVGCWVVVIDCTGNRDRHRKLARLVAEANPSKLQAPFKTESGFTVHTLEGGETRTAHLTGDDAKAIEGAMQ